MMMKIKGMVLALLLVVAGAAQAAGVTGLRSHDHSSAGKGGATINAGALTASSITTTGSVNAGGLSATGGLSVGTAATFGSTVTASGVVYANGSLSVTGTTNVNTLSASGAVSASQYNVAGHPVAGYAKVGTGIYRRTGGLPAVTNLVANTLTAVPAPAGAVGVIVYLRAVPQAVNALSLKTTNIDYYWDAAGTVAAGVFECGAMENPAMTAQSLGMCSGEVIVPVVSGNIYMRNGLSGSGYVIVGYTI